MITLGSAVRGPSPEILEAVKRASRVYLSLDSDPTGEKAAATRWPGSFERVIPPSGKDWTEYHQNKGYLHQDSGLKYLAACTASANFSRRPRLPTCRTIRGSIGPIQGTGDRSRPRCTGFFEGQRGSLAPCHVIVLEYWISLVNYT